MSLDIFTRELDERLAGFEGTQQVEPGVFDGFLRGSAQYAMRGLAKTGRAIDMAGAVAPIVQDAFTGGTAARDQYFREHDEVFGSAVDYWTPKPLEVGAAAEVVGTLVGQLPVIIANPHLAVGAQVLDTAEDLVAKGVPAGQAVGAGVVQGASLAAGIWMPVLGRSWAERVFVGGVSFNLAQGVLSRGATGLILEGTSAEKDFQPFDPKALTLDALLGFAFGNMVHLSPAQRAQGGEAWTRIQRWAEKATPTEVASIEVLRTAQHLNDDSLPGRPDAPVDHDAHVQRMRTAIDQLASDRPVQVDDLAAAKVAPDDARFTAAARRAEQMKKEGEALAKAYDLVLEEPIGPSNDPMARLSPEEIGDVLVERGPAFQKQGSAEIKVGGFGIVKFIWKHGEKSNKKKESQVTREDVMRAPEVLRDYEPISDVTDKDGRHLREWQIETEDGRKVIYATSKFTASDGEQHLVTLFVNDGSQPKIAAKGLSEKRNRQSESPGGASKARPGDTGLQTSSSSTSGQEGGVDSVRTEGPAGQPSGAEPPPPRGSEAGKPAGPEAAADPVRAAALRIAGEHPDLLLTVGHDAEGKPETMTVKEYLENAREASARAREDVALFEVAAQCMLGGA